ncbi:hypothetical protein AAVH_29437 [Aphelenchoides avenae]|nr:hypothetical protein AAVH_29437 [Aphelenchus avenae]
MCRGATLDGEPMIETIAQHAIAAAIVKKLPQSLAVKVIEQMLRRKDPLAWLEGQQQVFPERIHVSPMYYENAVLYRLTSCNVA